MPVSYIDSSSQEAATLSAMPSHQSGDMIIFFAFRDGSNVIPSLPAGYTSIRTATGTNVGARIGYKIATSAAESSPTWTNATDLVCHVYRGAAGPAATATATAASATVNYPALSLYGKSGTSWVVGFVGHQSTNDTMGTAPSGMTNRENLAGTTADAAGHDTNGSVGSWSNTNVVTSATATGNYISFVVEIVPSSHFVVNTNVTAGTTVPTGVSGCYVTLIGGGASGASGATRNGTTRPSGYGGGGGGGGAAIIQAFVPSASLGSTYQVTVGTGGTAPTATSQNGNSGNSSQFISGSTTITAGGGSGGVISLTPTGGAGGTYSGTSGLTYTAVENGADGGNASTSQTASSPGSNSTYAGAGGGGGGPNLSSGYNGGAGGTSATIATGGTAGAATGGAGGTPVSILGYGGAGAGGGAGGSGSTNGGAGGSGGTAGGGGGGGGGKEGSFSGAAALGGAGANGYTLIEWVPGATNLFFRMWN